MNAPGIAGCLAAWLLAAGATAQPRAEEAVPDGPGWLAAIGQLQVPAIRYRDGRRRHHSEDCSATLVARAGADRADTIVTAWHCLEFYRDLSHPITFTLPAPGGALALEAVRLADGGGMHADWAVLRLREPVPRAMAAALTVHPERADPDRPIAMAGYSRAGAGETGPAHLRYDPRCRITDRAGGDDYSDCQARKGASGGAVVQVTDRGEALFSGVISRGDGEGTSIFVPVARFRGAVERSLD